MRWQRVVAALAAAGLLALFGPWADRTEACCVNGTPPSISEVTVDPGQLWPPNHKMVDVIVNIAGDPGTLPTNWAISSVSVADVGGGAGDPLNDPDYNFMGAPVPWGDPNIVQLRAERSGPGEGRVYSIVVTASNDWGMATATALVLVPHDQGQ